MSPTIDRVNSFIQAGFTYALTPADLITFESALTTLNKGSGGTNLRNVFQHNRTVEAPDPNGHAYVPNTAPAFCLNSNDVFSETINTLVWVKTDGKISNTGWTQVLVGSIP